MRAKVRKVAFCRPFSILLTVLGGSPAAAATSLPSMPFSSRLSRMRAPRARRARRSASLPCSGSWGRVSGTRCPPGMGSGCLRSGHGVATLAGHARGKHGSGGPRPQRPPRVCSIPWSVDDEVARLGGQARIRHTEGRVHGRADAAGLKVASTQTRAGHCANLGAWPSRPRGGPVA